MKVIKPRLTEIKKKKQNTQNPKALDSIVRQILVSHQHSAVATKLSKPCDTHRTSQDILQEATLLWERPEVCHRHPRQRALLPATLLQNQIRTSAVRPPACPATAAPVPRRAAPGRPRSVTTRSVTGSPCPCSYTPWVCAPCPQRLLSGTPSFQLASTLWSDGGFSLMGWEEIALRKVLSFWNTSVSTVSKETKPKSQYHEKFTKKEQITMNCLIAHVKENGQEPTPLLPEGHRSTYQLAIGKSQHLPLFHPINLQLATEYHFQW